MPPCIIIDPPSEKINRKVLESVGVAGDAVTEHSQVLRGKGYQRMRAQLDDVRMGCMQAINTKRCNHRKGWTGTYLLHVVHFRSGD